MLTFSLSVPVLLGAAGLAVDSASFYNTATRMQSAADSSALSVAKELHLYAQKLDELKAVGMARVESLLTEVGVADMPHSAEVRINPATNVVEVAIELVSPSFLPANVWGENPIRVLAQARAFGQSKLCILGLHSSKSDTIKVAGTASVTAPDCAVQSNSTNPDGLNVDSGSQIVSTVICSTGGAKGGGSSYSPAPTTDCPALDDPLASRQPPRFSGCTIRDLEVKTDDSFSDGTIFCGGLKVTNGATASFGPGTYYFVGGKLEVKDTASIVGDYVSFVFNDDVSVFSFDKDTTIDLSAPKDGPMAGILFFENPLSLVARDYVIKSENAQRLLGTIYLPNGKLKIDSKSDVAAESAYTVIVTKQLEVKDANLVVNSDYGGTDVPVPEGLGPNSSMVSLNK